MSLSRRTSGRCEGAVFTTEESTLETSQLKMAAAPPPVYEPLQITGFLKTIPMFETVQSAIEAFKKQAA